MTSRYSSVSTLSTYDDAKSHATSSSLNNDDGFERHLLRPWSFLQTSDVSEADRDPNIADRDYQDSFDGVPIDGPPAYKSANPWMRFGGPNPEKSAKGKSSTEKLSNSWAKHADPTEEESEQESGEEGGEKGVEGEQLAAGRSGWWKEQMLVDRSFRSMAGLTSMFAFIMMIISIRYMPELLGRQDQGSSSVGSNVGQTCDSLEGTNVFLHLLINIAATLILGMSNTYQQLVTSLRFDELRWVLSRHGDSRVGTNSPMNIKHKKQGKRKAWASWLLLILTSGPIHLLANSVFGQSILRSSPKTIQYEIRSDTDPISTPQTDWVCWTAFRTGSFPPMTYHQSGVDDYDDNFELRQSYFGASILSIAYSERNCTQYKNSTTRDKLDLSEEYMTDPRTGYYSYLTYGVGECFANQNIYCNPLKDEELKCRISVRMSALLTLTVCLMIKATYMVAVNVASRRAVKSSCLTFGDVIVASSMDRETRIYNECMVNAGEGYRHRVAHTCHKHCKDHEPSETGDSIGHCQNCAKYNVKDKAADLPHPSIAIKYKKSLLSNLGSTALVQMILLMFCSLAMLAVSVFLAVGFGAAAQRFERECLHNGLYDFYGTCDNAGRAEYLKGMFGTFGGFNSSASLPGQMEGLTNEAVAFFVANAAQVLYSVLYLLLIYNLTLISMELDWGKFEKSRKRLRCTLVRGAGFGQSYLLQLPKKVLYPMMAFSAVMHWLLGQAISARETVYAERGDHGQALEKSYYSVVYGIYSIWFSTILMMVMTGVCWWAFTYTREGFIPQMYGSIRACCAASTELEDFPREGIQWGDLGEGKKFRHSGFSASEVGAIVPGELYCGRETSDTGSSSYSSKNR